MQDVKKTVQVSSNIVKACEHCADNVSAQINHYIGHHGYKLLHVGSETSHADNGGLWHSTVAILGK
jgi:hypothetical protein